jgi:hypothetical protein
MQLIHKDQIFLSETSVPASLLEQGTITFYSMILGVKINLNHDIGLLEIGQNDDNIQREMVT